MASPLRWFRKHSMYFMVVFGIAAMVIFGLGGVVSMINPSSIGQSVEGDRVVATWKGGELTRGQLRMMRNRHFQTQRFLEAVYTAAAQQKGEDFRPAVRMIRPLSPVLNEEQFDDQLLTRFLLAEKAKEEGFVVNDRMIYDYITQVGGDLPISKNEMRAINRKVNYDASELEHIVQNMRMELLNQQMSVLAGGGIPVIPNTTEAVQFYDRTRQRVECKVMPFSVEQYVSKVTEEPTRAEMREIFEEGRYEYPDTTGKRPGFKVGKQVKIKYFVGDYNTFLENEMNKLTPEEIQEEYDRLVETKDSLVMEVVPDEKPVVPEATGTDDPAPTRPNTDDDPAPALVPDSDETRAEDGAAGDSQPDESNESDGGGQSSWLVKPSSQYAWLQEDPPQEDPPQEDPPQQDPPQQDPPQQDPPQQDPPQQDPPQQDPAEQKPAQAANQSVTPVEQGSKPNENPQVNDGGDTDPASQSAGEETKPGSQSDVDKPDAIQQLNEPAGPSLDDKQEIKRRPKPLKDVVEEIKRRLKAADATAALNKALDGAEGELRKHQMQYARWQSRKYDGDKSDPPVEISYKSVADKYGLQFNETGLIDRRQIADEAIGKIISFEMGSDNRPRTIDVGQSIFDNYYETTEFEPNRAEDFATRSTYLYWLTEKIDQKVLEFNEATPEIKEYWQRKQALELAKKDAQSVADQVNGGKMLSALYPEKSNDTGSFSWFSNLGQVRYSTPIGVSEAGDEFMETVFELKENGAGVAANEPKDTVYVIQLIKDSDVTIEDIGTEYLEKQFFTFKRLPNEVTSLSEIYLRQLNFQWQDEFLDDMQLKWIGR